MKFEVECRLIEFKSAKQRCLAKCDGTCPCGNRPEYCQAETHVLGELIKEIYADAANSGLETGSSHAA